VKKAYTRCWWIIFAGIVVLGSLELTTDTPGPVLLALALLVEAAVIALYLRWTRGMEMTGQKARYFTYTVFLAAMLLLPKNVQPRSFQTVISAIAVLQAAVIVLYDRKKARCSACQAWLPLFGDSHRCAKCFALFGEEP